LTSVAARLSLVLALIGTVACAKTPAPVSSPVATRTPRAGTPSADTGLNQDQRLQSECPPETRADCITAMTSLLRSRDNLGRIALCVDRSGNWLERHEKVTKPEQELPSDARVGDRCPDALPYAIRGIYTQDAAR